jgi:phytoene/squalene synthetase
MVAMALDTHAFVKTLTAAGMPEAQAEAVTTLVTVAREADTAQLVTKADLQIALADLKAEFKDELQREIGGLRTEQQRDSSSGQAEQATTRSDLLKDLATTKSDLLKELSTTKSDLLGELSTTRSDLLKWMIGLVLGAVLLNAMTVIGAMVALIKVLGH